jgi:5-methylcytosine-specific restriction protein A
MKTFLLTWNPSRWEWDSLDDDIEYLKNHGFFEGTWSTGVTKKIEVGDRIFLIRLGTEPRGILASGFALSGVYQKSHWNPEHSGPANYIDVRFDRILSPESDGVLPIEILKIGPTAGVNWSPQASGTSIDSSTAIHLEELWGSFLEQKNQSPLTLPEEIAVPSHYYEGATRQIFVNAYERNPRARKACIDHFGHTCSVCGFDFESFYGEIGTNFIHVHHLVPVSEIGSEYSINPIRDLRPVCPNCHAMLHRNSSVLSIEELQAILRRTPNA